MARIGTPLAKTSAGARGLPASGTDAGPPDRSTAFGFSRAKASEACENGWISQKTPASRTRRAISCVTCEPKSTMRTKSWLMPPHVAQRAAGCNGAAREAADRAQLTFQPDRRHDEVDKSPHLGWAVMARRVNRVERKDLAVPVRKQFDERAFREPILRSELHDLRDACSRDAGVQHGSGIGRHQPGARLDGQDLLAFAELPLVRALVGGVPEINAGVAHDLRGTRQPAGGGGGGGRSDSQNTGLDELCRDKAARWRLTEAQRQVKAVRNKIAD